MAPLSTSVPARMVARADRVAFNVADFDQLLRDHGVKLIHFRAMRCPVGMKDLRDNRRPGHDHEGCSNGYIYTDAGSVIGVFTSNSDSVKSTEAGSYDSGTASVTFARHYHKELSDASALREFQCAQFDRLYLDDDAVSVSYWQLFAHHASGRDRLSFPALSVEEVIDTNGARYGASDFTVNKGQLLWGDKQPPDGAICSVRYTYRPFWYVSDLGHEIRIVRAIAPESGQHTTVRMPIQARLVREYLFQTADQVEGSTDPRQVQAAPTDIFGPR